jgi:16S rRNA (adenine1518-N6/adenine1519-N6)-dimethyltransferase
MTIQEVRGILDAYSIRPTRGSGQNFLVDEDIASRIVEAAGCDSETVVEIGPGLGILTKYLAERAGLVLGIEVSRRLCAYLSQRFSGTPNFVLINADFLDLDLEDLSLHADRFKIVSNLPYSISKPAISRILRLRQMVESATLTVQQEVARRIMASPGTKDYGVLTVMVAFSASAESLLDIESHSFFPRPKVNSTTIKLYLHDEPPLDVTDEGLFQSVVRGAFSQRRKMLRNSLGPHLKLEPGLLSELERASGIDFGRRGETLSISEFVHLSNTLSAVLPEPGAAHPG